MDKPNPAAPLKVFISYSHDSTEHEDWVAQFAYDLRVRGGVESIIDQYVEGAFPDEDWDTWMFRQIRGADFVLCICTETYKKRAEGDEEPGKGLGVKWEGNIIRKKIYDDIENNQKKFVAVIPPGSDKANKPYFLPIHIFRMPDSWDNLFRLFSNLSQTAIPPINSTLYKPEVKNISSTSLTPTTPASNGIGRSDEIAQLVAFWNSSDKRIFTFYGVAQMGKSFTIQYWSDHYLQDYETVRITLTEDIPPTEIACDNIFSTKEMPEKHLLSQKIAARFQRKTLVWFENTELALVTKDGQDSHRFKEAQLEQLVIALSKNSHLKIVLECRYFIDLPETLHLQIGLKENQLQKINPDYFWGHYKQEFTREEYELIYEKTGGNTWLLLNIPYNFRDLFFDKTAFLDDIQESTQFDIYRDKYLFRLLDSLNESEKRLFFYFSFAYKPRKKEQIPITISNKAMEACIISLYRKLLIIEEHPKEFAINGYVREACRKHFKNSPVMQEMIKEQEWSFGKQFRTQESPEDHVDRINYLIQQNPTNIQNYIELSKAYEALEENTKAIETLREALKKTPALSFKNAIYTELIRLSDYSKALRWLKEMKQEGIVPDEVTYAVIIAKCEDEESIQSWFEEMKREGLKPDEISYSTLVNRSDNYPTALKWFEEMRREGLKPNEISYNTLVNRSDNYPTALKWFEEMRREGLKPNEISYSTLVNRSDNYPTALKWFEEMRREGLKPNEISYSTLVNRSDNYPTALKWFEEMRREGLKPNEISYNTLVNRSDNYPTALKWFEEMRREGLKPNEISYSTLVNRSDNYPTALKWFEEMRREGLKPDEISYNTLVNRSDNYPTALKWFEDMRREGLKPNEISYSTLVNRSDNYPTALKWFEEMRREGLKPNEISYSTLVNRSDNYPTAFKWFEEMKKTGIRPNVLTFNTLLKKCNTWLAAQPLLEEMIGRNISPQLHPPKTYTFTALRQLMRKQSSVRGEITTWLGYQQLHGAWQELFEQLMASRQNSKQTVAMPTTKPKKEVFSKEVAKRLIEKNSVKEAFKYLQKYGNNDNALTLIQSEWNSYIEDVIKGVLSEESTSLQRRKIFNRLMEWIDHVA